MTKNLAPLCRLRDLEDSFGNHRPRFSEVFWNSIEHLLESNGKVISGSICQAFMEKRARTYDKKIHEKGHTVPSCVVFINRADMEAASLQRHLAQCVVCNGHKKKHAPKVQVMNT